jgi:two-component system chemotaxis response regulator CheB
VGAAGRIGAIPIRRNPEPPIRLMIVDDSSVARAVLSRMIGVHHDLEVAALAGNAAEALDALRAVQVDIVLLDLEMPGASGLDALPEILVAGAGASVLIVSSLAEAGAEATVKALALGAADTLPKPGTGAFGGRFSDVLADRLRRIGRARREPERRPSPRQPDFQLRAMPDAPLGCVAIGASTGGLPALNEFLAALPRRTGAPILVTQHLPALFMTVFARQLEAAAGRPAAVVADGQLLVADRVHIAPGDAHLQVERSGSRVVVRLGRAPMSSGCLPSADPMLASVAEAYGPEAVGVMLSGMGRDGLDGARQLIACGGAMLAQDRASSAVWGMPRAVAEAGLAAAVLAPVDLARRLTARLEATRR